MNVPILHCLNSCSEFPRYLGSVEHKREALAQYALPTYLFFRAVLCSLPQDFLSGGKRGHEGVLKPHPHCLPAVLG